MAYMTDDKIQKMIPSIKKRAASIRKDVIAVASAILHNWAESGAVNVAAQRAGELFDAVDDAHKTKVAKWFGDFAGFSFSTEEDSVAVTYDQTKLSAKQFQAAVKMDLFKYSPDDLSAFNLDAMIANLVARAEKRAAAVEGKRHEDDAIDLEKLAALKALVPSA